MMGEISLGCCRSGRHPGAPLHIPGDAASLHRDVFAYFLHEQILVSESSTSSAHNMGIQGLSPSSAYSSACPWESHSMAHSLFAWQVGDTLLFGVKPQKKIRKGSMLVILSHKCSHHASRGRGCP